MYIRVLDYSNDKNTKINHVFQVFLQKIHKKIMDTIKSRLKHFIKRSLRMTQHDFADKIGVSYGWIDGIQNSLQQDTQAAIREAFPNLNMTWLMMGEGPMLLDEGDNPAAATPPNSQSPKLNKVMDCKACEKILQKKEEQLSELIHQNRVLTDIIARLTGGMSATDKNSPPLKK